MSRALQKHIIFTDIVGDHVTLCCSTFYYNKGDRLEFGVNSVLGRKCGCAVTFQFNYNGKVDKYLTFNIPTLELYNQSIQVGIGYKKETKMHWTYKPSTKKLVDYTGDFFYVENDPCADGHMVPYLKLVSDPISSDRIKCLCMEDKRIVSLDRFVTVVPLGYDLKFFEKTN